MIKQPIKKDEIVSVKVSSVQEWKKKISAPLAITLPSGAVVEIKRLNLFECIVAGYIPLELLQQIMTAGDKMSSADGWSKLQAEELAQLLTIVKKVASLSLISPKLGEDLSIDDIPESDLFTIFSLAMESGGLNFRGFR